MEEELMEIVSKVLADDLPWLDADLDEFAGRIASAILSTGYVKKDEVKHQLLEKLGEKKVEIGDFCKGCLNGSKCFFCSVQYWNSFHDHITSIINEVLPVGEKERKNES